MILVIDNYDSFTYNLVQYLQEMEPDVRVYRNDEITISEIERLNPTHIVISPGPGDPTEAGISVEVIQRLAGTKPILGVCLGHQALGYAFGGKIVRAKKPMHGKISPILHDGKNLFSHLPKPFNATRYHSLLVERRESAVLLGNQRLDTGRGNHGLAAQDDSGSGRRSVSSRIHSHHGRQEIAGEFSDAED